MLEAFAAPGRFLRGNLHCHSTRSDGELEPEQVCAFYRDAGYDFICLSDHFLATYDFPITDTRPFRRDGFTTLIGAELHAGATSVGEMWHILGVGLPFDFAHTNEEESGPELARRAAEAGAFVAIPHPEWYSLTSDDAASLDAAVAVEVHNQVCHVESARGGGAALFDLLLHQGRRLGAIAVDDAHRYDADALGGWVMVKAEAAEPDVILKALRSGAYYATRGPVIEHIARDGDHLHFQTSPCASIHLLGPGPRSEALRGEAITRGRLPLERFEGGWCRAVVSDANGLRAWTSALWLS